ncbi:hypothetical protein BDQ12DRAFT_668164 [Crucibulum laeve]|uniref:Uncharacterized protein n=1 Tax=Crucibulum laeve TaxID=68775 RepID=A0A5C3LTC5_9AGAR|nr:hypothetical protein BDQ12DRAFT_668164 [Crucibulum laeve]
MAACDDNTAFLLAVLHAKIAEYRDKTFTQDYICTNALKFLSTDWIVVAELKQFLATHEAHVEHTSKLLPIVKNASRSIDICIPIKQDPAVNVTSNALSVKKEAIEHIDLTDVDSPTTSHTTSIRSVKTRLISENGHETIEILSSNSEDNLEDPEDQQNSDIPMEALKGSGGYETDTDIEMGSHNEEEASLHSTSPSDFDFEDDWIVKPEDLAPSGTIWLDPILRIKTDYILDLCDVKYDIHDENMDELLTVDAIVKNKDQDSWTGTTGEADSKVSLEIFTEHNLLVLVVMIVSKLTPNLWMLSTLNWILSLWKQLCSLRFWFIIHSAPCSACDSDGALCDGNPIMKACKQTESQQKHYFIACNQWSPSFCDGHCSHSIPDDVEESLLAQLFAGKTLEGFSEGPVYCSCVIPKHIGGRVKRCYYPHYRDGKIAKMIKHKCNAAKVGYIPMDTNLHMICIVPTVDKPHTHPILPAIKTTHDIRKLYIDCIWAAGVEGATVRLVDNAPSTQLIMGCTTPALLAPALQNSHVKQDLVNKQKSKQYPSGFGVAGIMDLMKKDLSKPIEDCYIHSIITMPGGGLLIFTLHQYLASLIHYEHVYSFNVDTTFQCTVGDMNEWEVHLSEGGNLLSLGVDLKAAQVLRAGDSFLPTNKPGYSNINVTTDWWAHKVNNTWILPAIIQCCSGITTEDWVLTKATTNIGEGQHHWTNIHTGTKLTLLEAIVSACKLDNEVVAEIKASLTSGVLKNQHNDSYNCVSRQASWASNAACKKCETDERDDALSKVNHQIEALTREKKDNDERLKALKAAKAESCSSGCIKSLHKENIKAHNAVKPYNIDYIMSSNATASSQSVPNATLANDTYQTSFQNDFDSLIMTAFPVLEVSPSKAHPFVVQGHSFLPNITKLVL